MQGLEMETIRNQAAAASQVSVDFRKKLALNDLPEPAMGGSGGAEDNEAAPATNDNNRGGGGGAAAAGGKKNRKKNN